MSTRVESNGDGSADDIVYSHKRAPRIEIFKRAIDCFLVFFGFFLVSPRSRFHFCFFVSFFCSRWNVVFAWSSDFPPPFLQADNFLQEHPRTSLLWAAPAYIPRTRDMIFMRESECFFSLLPAAIHRSPP